MAQLALVLRRLLPKVQEHRSSGIGEQNTKAVLIDPILESLGWNVRDWDEVQREYKVKSKDKPVDYALKISRVPKLFVEAKALGENLKDRRWVNQVISYAAVAGVEWCVLTDGDEYRFYNASAPVQADEKLLCEIRLSEAKLEDAISALSLLSRSNLEDNSLASLWQAHFVDRRVRAALEAMLKDVDRGLVRVLRKQLDDLTPKQVGDSLRRLRFHAEPPPMPRKAVPATVASTPAQGRRGQRKRGRHDHGVELVDLIKAGLLSPSTELVRRYKQKVLQGTLLQDGQVEFQGTTYPSCSKAGEAARAAVAGRRMNTNGWSFWQVRDDGQLVTLKAVRERYLATRAQ